MRCTALIDQLTRPIRRACASSVVLMVAASGSAVGQPGHVHAISAVATVDADAYVSAARRATEGLETPDAARAAGYVPVFGVAPLQGEHYARPDLVMRDSFDLHRPSVVMFASVRGRPTLVGVAYTFYLPETRMAPRGWTGPSDVWHAHDDIARIPGKHIVMMHTWFIDSPFGALAHDNPWLPFIAAGIAPPSMHAPSDSDGMALTRRVGLALALLAEPPALIDPILQGEPLLGLQTTLVKADIGAMVGRLRAAQTDGDTAASGVLQRDLAARGDSLVALYRQGAAKTPALREGFATLVDMYLGKAVR